MRYALIGLVVSVLFAVGCAGTPRQNFAQAQDVFIASQEILISARRSGEIDTPTWEQEVLPRLELGDFLLDRIDSMSAAGQDPGSMVEQLRRLLSEIRPYVVEVEDR